MGNNSVVTNDSKIMDLKQQIAKKRGELDKVQKFNPVTNCSIDVEGIRYNLNVLGREQLIALVVKLNAYKMSAKDLGLLEQYSISGYNVEGWITDIKSKLEVISRKGEEVKLKMMEDKLTELLSNEKKVELELGEIEEFLKL